MKRMLWTITAIGALAVPAGWAAAQTEDDGTVDDTPTTVVCDQDQVRDQLRLRDGTGDQERAQQRLHQQDCDACDHEQYRDRQQTRLEDGTNGMPGRGDRQQLHDGTGGQARMGGHGR